MCEGMTQNEELKHNITLLRWSIEGDAMHGRCFYEKERLDHLIKTLDKLKETSIAYYNSNKEEGKEWEPLFP